MKINVHAGHNPDGKVACGAVKYLKESTEARAVCKEVIKQLKAAGHTVYDCTVDNGTSQSDVLNKIIAKCNAHTVDLDVSIHFNAGAPVQKKDGKTTGTEIWIYANDSLALKYANNVLAMITGGLGFKSRGVKTSKDLKYLRSVTAAAMLIECCFVDDEDDAAIYNAKDMATAIVNGILDNGAILKKETVYSVQVGSFKIKANAESMLAKLKKAGFEGVIVGK